MSIFSRFFGRQEDDVPSIALVANPDLPHRLSLQVVFDGPLAIDASALGQALRAYHPGMKSARSEFSPDVPQVFGLVGWGRHVVQLVGFDAPFPSENLEACVQPSHYPQEVKEQVRAHQSHVILYYAGYDEDPQEQYVALAAVAGALAGFGALAVLNEEARTSLPIGVLSHESLGNESLEILRDGLPMTMLFCGFVKYEVEGVAGVWMRTYGAQAYGLPDFAALAEGHHEGERYSGVFNNILAYLRQSGAAMAAGHTMQIGETTYMKLREPAENEYYLQGPGTTLVAELIESDQVNH